MPRIDEVDDLDGGPDYPVITGDYAGRRGGSRAGRPRDAARQAGTRSSASSIPRSSTRSWPDSGATAARERDDARRRGPTRGRRAGAGRPARAAAAPGRRQPLPPRHRGRGRAGCEPGDGARGRGRRRRHRGSCRSAATCPARAGRWRPPTRTTRSSPASRCTPTRRRDSTAAGELDDALAEIERLATTSDRVRAVGETGLDYYRTGPGRASRRRSASFRAHIELAKRLGKTLGDPRPRRPRRRAARARRARACRSARSSTASPVTPDDRPRLRRPWLVSVVRRHGDVQERRSAAGRAGGHAARSDPGRDRRALPDADARTGAVRTRRTWSRSPCGPWPRCAATTSRSSCPAIDANTDAAFGGGWG